MIVSRAGHGRIRNRRDRRRDRGDRVGTTMLEEMKVRAVEVMRIATIVHAATLGRRRDQDLAGSSIRPAREIFQGPAPDLGRSSIKAVAVTSAEAGRMNGPACRVDRACMMLRPGDAVSAS